MPSARPTLRSPSSRGSSFAWCVALAAALATGACTAPEVPTVKPVSGRVLGINTTGLELEAKLEAENKNDFDIEVKSFTATITLDKTIKIGTVSAPNPVTLPANKKKVFDVPMSVKWNDAMTLAPLALSNRDVPWEAEGKVQVGGNHLDVELPFKVSGVVTHQQIVQAAGRSLPKIPGIPLPL
jgi:LEA14-like dessication related protein